MADVRLLAVPWDSGHRDVRMGAGPTSLLDAGLADLLREDGHRVEVRMLDPEGSFPAEVATAFELARALSRAVADARREGARPVVLSGGCGSSTGTVAGLDPDDIGVVWFDSHGDLNTPETTTSGFVDGTAAATLLGRCWTSLAAGVPGFRPLPAERLVYVGLRALDPPERDWLEEAPVARVAGDAIRERGVAGALDRSLARLADAGVRRAYVHVDMDALDPSVARVNGYQADGGLTLEELTAAVALVGNRLGVAAGAVTSFDPDADPEGRGIEAGLAVARALAGAG